MASSSTLLAQLKCHFCRGHYSSYSIPTPVIPYQIILFHLLHGTYHHIHAYVHIYIVVSMKVWVNRVFPINMKGAWGQGLTYSPVCTQDLVLCLAHTNKYLLTYRVFAKQIILYGINKQALLCYANSDIHISNFLEFLYTCLLVKSFPKLCYFSCFIINIDHWVLCTS